MSVPSASSTQRQRQRVDSFVRHIEIHFPDMEAKGRLDFVRPILRRNVQEL